MPVTGGECTETRERFRGALLGLACGDAVGTSVEFQRRGSFAPLTDMIGGGPFSLQPGQWTDDTSMALCLATSLLDSGGFVPADQMRRYCRWMEEAYLSSTGECFDIGMTVSDALQRFLDDGEPFAGSTDPRTAGNGCLMRLAPVPMYYFADRASAIAYAGESARTTHGALECIEASRLFGAMLWLALSGATKEAILCGHGMADLQSERLASIAHGAYRGQDAGAIRGNGYVVDSLEAALWCFARTATFEEAILCAANLGDDADTTAAICGQLAGAFYGQAAIPLHWQDRLAWAGRICALADCLHDAQQATRSPQACGDGMS